VADSNNGSDVQNVMLVALKSTKKPVFRNQDNELNGYLQHLWNKEVQMDIPLLTDDHAPVDNYILKVIKDL
jgi:hypothetical protein